MCLFRWLSFAYQWCSAPHSSPLGIHISHLYKFRALCSGDGRHAGHRPPLSSPLHSDMPRQCRHHECRSLRNTLLEEKRKLVIDQHCSVLECEQHLGFSNNLRLCTKLTRISVEGTHFGLRCNQTLSLISLCHFVTVLTRNIVTETSVQRDAVQDSLQLIPLLMRITLDHPFVGHPLNWQFLMQITLYFVQYYLIKTNSDNEQIGRSRPFLFDAINVW